MQISMATNVLACYDDLSCKTQMCKCQLGVQIPLKECVCELLITMTDQICDKL